MFSKQPDTLWLYPLVWCDRASGQIQTHFSAFSGEIQKVKGVFSFLFGGNLKELREMTLENGLVHPPNSAPAQHFSVAQGRDREEAEEEAGKDMLRPTCQEPSHDSIILDPSFSSAI